MFQTFSALCDRTETDGQSSMGENAQMMYLKNKNKCINAIWENIFRRKYKRK